MEDQGRDSTSRCENRGIVFQQRRNLPEKRFQQGILASRSLILEFSDYMNNEQIELNGGRS